MAVDSSTGLLPAEMLLQLPAPAMVALMVVLLRPAAAPSVVAESTAVAVDESIAELVVAVGPMHPTVLDCTTLLPQVSTCRILCP